VSSVASQASKVQYGALPWRRVEGAIEILLVTTRNTRRWIVPKGWPLTGRSAVESAAREALEEAGVLGEMAEQMLGSFHYNKRRKSGEVVPCKVHVFAMEVMHQRRRWAEKSARETRWCSLEEALSRVNEPGLRRLIAKFARASRRSAEHRGPNGVRAS
jgi:8-oxo-dGTP pyrophosphatase MutT (NUDIX family)